MKFINMYKIEELNKRYSGYVLEVKSRQEHEHAKRLLPNMSNYDSRFSCYLIPNEGVGQNRKSYGFGNYKVITIDQIIGLNFYEYEIY